jgi:hypothetical protein
MHHLRLQALVSLGITGALLVGCESGNSGDSADDSASAGASETDGGASGDADGGGAGSESESDTDGASGDADSDDPSDGSTTGDSTDGDTNDTGDETDGETDGEVENEVCAAPGDLMPCDGETDDPFKAIGLNCPLLPNQSIPILNETFVSADPLAWRIARQYGSHVDELTGEPAWGPREGEQFLIITTGHLPEPDESGVITLDQGSTQSGTSNDNPNDQPLPSPMSALVGSANGNGGTPFVDCDAVNDCSDSLQDQWALGNNRANDLLWFQFSLPVPGGTHGFSFDFAYFSAEFPEFVDTSFNDVFAVWSSSESYTGNLCFVNDQPCTVTALANAVQFEGEDPELVGTGFEGISYGTTPIAQSTGWFAAKGSAQPNEVLQLTFALFDMGDSIYDTTVILDNFQWDCKGCVPTEVDPCIGIDPV